jgi:hypothetical protein
MPKDIKEIDRRKRQNIIVIYDGSRNEELENHIKDLLKDEIFQDRRIIIKPTGIFVEMKFQTHDVF